MPAPSPRHLARLLTRPLGWLSERLGNRFYLVLAALVVAATGLAIATGTDLGMKSQAYDLVMRNRFRTPAPDPRIVLVDIDEASLAAMAPEYGRWPWPRTVMAELVEGLAQAGVAAVVFDVVFADLDRGQPDSDQHLRDVAASHPQTYFAMIRLDAANDRLSRLELAHLAGVTPLPDAVPGATAAAVVPYFFDVLDGRRLGTINLFAGRDGIARTYHVHRDVHGYRMFSLAANVVAGLGGELPASPDILLNWRGPPPAYRSVPFHLLHQQLLRGTGELAAGLADRIVIVGSTAPALFDIRPTPVAQAHTGVEILATAMDNLRNRDYLKELPDWIYFLVAAGAVFLLAAAFRNNVDELLLRTAFTVMQGAFLALTYLFLNYTTWFVDLTAPFTAAFAYFILAGFYHRVLVLRRNGHPWLSSALDPGRTAQVLLLVCRVTAPAARRARVHRILQRQSGLTRYGAAAPQLFGTAPLFEKLHEDVALFYWLVPPEKTCTALLDLCRMLEQSLLALGASGDGTGLRLALHSTRFTVESRDDWARQGKEAFATALLLAERPARGSVVLSESFSETCHTCQDARIPQRLEQLGLAPAGATASP
ncbi:MAG: CHASE2 domain-containing protein [Steroidobacteraceae bacterium]|nr:CHASE2 domain-containing protein [Steroidobacteraceae bacterium]